MDDKLSPITLFTTAFVISALAGVAALLRSTKELTVRMVVSAILNSGALGLGLALLLFTYFKENTWFLLGLCILAGLGGMTVLGFVLWLFKQGGADVHISFTKKKKDPEPEPEEHEADVLSEEPRSSVSRLGSKVLKRPANPNPAESEEENP